MVENFKTQTAQARVIDVVINNAKGQDNAVAIFTIEAKDENGNQVAPGGLFSLPLADLIAKLPGWEAKQSAEAEKTNMSPESIIKAILNDPEIHQITITYFPTPVIQILKSLTLHGPQLDATILNSSFEASVDKVKNPPKVR